MHRFFCSGGHSFPKIPFWGTKIFFCKKNFKVPYTPRGNCQYFSEHFLLPSLRRVGGRYGHELSFAN